MNRLALVCALLACAGCADPQPPARGPNFEGVVRDVALGQDGVVHVLVEALPVAGSAPFTQPSQTPPTHADVLLSNDAMSLAQQPGGGNRFEAPSATWIGRMVRVWFARAGSAAEGERFQGIASAIVVEPPRSGVGP